MLLNTSKYLMHETESSGWFMYLVIVYDMHQTFCSENLVGKTQDGSNWLTVTDTETVRLEILMCNL